MKTVALVCTLDNVEFLVDRDQAVMLKTIDAVLEGNKSVALSHSFTSLTNTQ